MSVRCDVRLNAARHGEQLCLLICHFVAASDGATWKVVQSRVSLIFMMVKCESGAIINSIIE